MRALAFAMVALAAAAAAQVPATRTGTGETDLHTAWLGELLDLSGPDAADALSISPELFRKRLQHARTAIESFTRTYCGLVSDSAACTCHRRVPAAVRLGRVRAAAPDFAAAPASFQETRALVRRVEDARRALEVHRTSHPRASSVDFARELVASLEGNT